MEQPEEQLAEEIYNTTTAGSYKMDRITLNNLVKRGGKLKNLSLSQLNVLSFLESREYVIMKDIGKELEIKPSSVTNLVNRLIKADLVERSYDPHDRRIIKVNLSEEGKALIEEVRNANRKYWEKILKKIEKTEYEEILRVLKKLHKILCETIEK